MFLDRIDNIEIELTTLCNARCPMCSRQVEGTTEPDTSLPIHHITIEQAKRLASFIPRVELILSGNFGDPIANPDVFEILTILSPRVIKMRLDTNASLRTPDFWQKLAKIDNLEVIFSIDGLSDTNHIYRVNTNYDKIIENATAFIGAGGYAEWKFIAFKHNEHQIEQARKLSIDMGFKRFASIHSKRWLGEPVIIDGIELAPSSDATVHSFKSNNIFSGEIECKSQKQRILFISADFKLLPCCFFNVDRVKYKDRFYDYWKYEYDLEKYTIEELLNTDYYKNLLPASFKNDSCYHLCKKICDSKKNYWKKYE